MSSTLNSYTTKSGTLDNTNNPSLVFRYWSILDVLKDLTQCYWICILTLHREGLIVLILPILVYNHIRTSKTKFIKHEYLNDHQCYRQLVIFNHHFVWILSFNSFIWNLVDNPQILTRINQKKHINRSDTFWCWLINSISNFKRQIIFLNEIQRKIFEAFVVIS